MKKFNKKTKFIPEVKADKENDEITEAITAEDVVEQVFYMANAPECCAGDHAKNMLGMLGANVIDESLYHSEDECPNKMKKATDYIVSEGTQHSRNGTWEISFTELFYHFEIDIKANDKTCEELTEMLQNREEVEVLEITEDGINITYKTEYCRNLLTQNYTQRM